MTNNKQIKYDGLPNGHAMKVETIPQSTEDTVWPHSFETPSWCPEPLHRLLRCGRTRERHWDNENTHEMRVNSKRIRYAMNGERSGSEYYGLKGVFCRTVNRAPSLCGFRGPPRPARTLSHRQLRFRKSRDNRRQRKTSVKLTSTSLGMIISDKGMVRTSSDCSHFGPFSCTSPEIQLQFRERYKLS